MRHIPSPRSFVSIHTGLGAVTRPFGSTSGELGYRQASRQGYETTKRGRMGRKNIRSSLHTAKLQGKSEPKETRRNDRRRTKRKFIFSSSRHPSFACFLRGPQKKLYKIATIFSQCCMLFPLPLLHQKKTQSHKFISVKWSLIFS